MGAKRPFFISLVLCIVPLAACDSPFESSTKPTAFSSNASARRAVPNESSSNSFEAQIDRNGHISLPGQRLPSWSGQTVLGSSSFDLVPLD